MKRLLARAKSWLWDHINPIRRSAYEELRETLEETEKWYEAACERERSTERTLEAVGNTCNQQHWKITEIESKNEALKRVVDVLLKDVKIEDHGCVIDRPAHRIVLEIQDHIISTGRDVGSVIGEMIAERIRQRTLDAEGRQAEARPMSEAAPSIRQMAALDAAASPGPWVSIHETDGGEAQVLGQDLMPELGGNKGRVHIAQVGGAFDSYTNENADLTAATRTRWQAALALLESLAGDLDAGIKVCKEQNHLYYSGKAEGLETAATRLRALLDANLDASLGEVAP